MAAKGLNVKIVDEILRLKTLGFGKRKISRILGLHRNTISKYFDPTGPPVAPTDSIAQDAMVLTDPPDWCKSVDWQLVRDEILKNVPISIVYEELVDQGKVKVQYPAFWKQLHKRAPLLKTTMVRGLHRAHGAKSTTAMASTSSILRMAN
jgi:hypothetical protein